MLVFKFYNDIMKKIYNSKKWDRVREFVLKRDNYLCRNCYRYGRTTPGDTVHHMLPAEDYPEYKYNDINLITLCKKCHNLMHERNTRKLTLLGKEYQRKARLKLKK